MKNNFYREGWVCPICGAVMSPYCDICKNCTGKFETIIISTTKNYDFAKKETNKILQWRLTHPDLEVDYYVENIMNKDKGEIK